MLSELMALSAKNSIRQLDAQFARFIHSIETQAADEVAFIAGVLSSELSKGHICIKISDLDFVEMLGLYGETAERLLNQLNEIDWHATLNNASCVGDDQNNLTQPLIYDGQRLYLQRYWYYEQFLADRLNSLSQPIPFSREECDVLAQRLTELFPSADIHLDEPNWQKVAVAVALSSRLSVISGGPGTGKTTTVVKLLSALIEQGLQKGNVPKIKLVAPTGKAAARLTESIGSAVKTLSVNSETKLLIPSNASTIHRLLGALPNRAEFRHNKSNPLHLDLLVVDEASMVDLPLMAKLLEALPEQARLVLLGDKDQLASVEAGAVLGDICSFIDDGYSEEQSQILARLTGFESTSLSVRKHKADTARLSDSLCMLRKSYRFDENSGIGVLAKAINASNVTMVRKALSYGYSDLTFHPLTTQSYQDMIRFLVDEYSAYLNCVHDAAGLDISLVESQALQALSLFSNCRLLCAIREGDFGLSGLNQQLEKALSQSRLIQRGDDLWYVGRPVMITRNDHALGLFNGDIGIAMLVSDKNEMGESQLTLKVYFELPDGSVKAVLPSRIPEHDTAYAMTIHKSQGSEFPTTVMVLPNTYSPILTKEIIYTGVTRARNKLVIVADNSVLLKGVKKKTKRLSGLRYRLKMV